MGNRKNEGYFWDLEFDQNVVQDSENTKYLDGKQDLTATWDADSPKFRHRMEDFLIT